jgi:hypothetical protein
VMVTLLTLSIYLIWIGAQLLHVPS